MSLATSPNSLANMRVKNRGKVDSERKTEFVGTAANGKDLVFSVTTKNGTEKELVHIAFGDNPTTQRMLFAQYVNVTKDTVKVAQEQGQSQQTQQEMLKNTGVKK